MNLEVIIFKYIWLLSLYYNNFVVNNKYSKDKKKIGDTVGLKKYSILAYITYLTLKSMYRESIFSNIL